MLWNINVESEYLLNGASYNKMDPGSKLRGNRDPFVELHQLDQWANIMGWSFNITQLPVSIHPLIGTTDPCLSSTQDS